MTDSSDGDHAAHLVRTPRLPRIVQIVVIALSVLAVGAFLFVALSRIRHPYELEFMTGACLDHVLRILDGQQLYVKPTADFVTWLYGPLFFYVGALASLVAGEASLVVLRVVSLGAALISTALAFWTILKVTGNRTAAIAAAGLWCATYGIVGTWWDIGRVDSLFVTWTAAALALLWTREGRNSAILAGVIMTLGYLTKQTALVLVPPFAIGLAFWSLSRAAWFVGAFAVTLIPTALVLDVQSDGWFSYYTWEVPRSHSYSIEAWWQYFPGDTLVILPMVLAAAWHFVRLLRTSRARAAWTYAAFGSGLWLACNLSRAHVGGAENVMIPTHFSFSLLAALALAEAAGDRVWRWVIGGLVTLQFVISVYNPLHYLPTDADRLIGDKLIAELRGVEGNVMVPLHGNYGTRVGKPQSAHGLAMIDIERGPDPDFGQQLRADFLRYSWDKDCDLLVFSMPGKDADMLPLIVRDPNQLEWTSHLLFEDPLDEAGNPILQENGRMLFMPVVGLQTRPQQLLRRLRK